MIRLNQIKLPYEHSDDQLKKATAKMLKCMEKDIEKIEIVKISIDARKKPDIFKIYTLDVQLFHEKNFSAKIKKLNLNYVKNEPYKLPEPGSKQLTKSPVIVGTGPAGLFCGLMLARAGYRPIILERGEQADIRKSKVEAFWTGNELDLKSNAQFGEGGAGTFSDGKLNTLVKDPAGRNKEVLKIFVEKGAPKEILYINKPHIGTDLLIEVVKNIRNEIIELGGEVRFCHQMTRIHSEHGTVTDIEVIDFNTDRKYVLSTEVLVLAIGHSARDTFEMLYKKGIYMIEKAFAVGVRIEHPQEMIQESQYGKNCKYQMPAASYKLTHTCDNKRGVYSFCMCPGGYVVNASSEQNRTAVNGMSYHARDSKNANSAIIVTVTPDDFGERGPLSGIAYQRALEEKAYEIGQGKVPQQLFGDFCSKRISSSYGEVISCTKGERMFAAVHEIFSEEIQQSIIEGIQSFGKKIKGFSREDAVLSGVESRTSSPVRIVRDEQYESNIKGVYPCGEGAGYAGGITSAAMDGMRVAEQIIASFKY